MVIKRLKYKLGPKREVLISLAVSELQKGHALASREEKAKRIKETILAMKVTSTLFVSAGPFI
jgi:hypothetical protein